MFEEPTSLPHRQGNGTKLHSDSLVLPSRASIARPTQTRTAPASVAPAARLPGPSTGALRRIALCSIVAKRPATQRRAPLARLTIKPLWVCRLRVRRRPSLRSLRRPGRRRAPGATRAASRKPARPFALAPPASPPCRSALRSGPLPLARVPAKRTACRERDSFRSTVCQRPFCLGADARGTYLPVLQARARDQTASDSQFDSHADGLTATAADDGGGKASRTNLARTPAEAGGRPDST